MPSVRKEVSVVIPAYNEEKRIARTLRSVYDYLSEHNYKFEIIVCDDGSTDGTAAVVNGFIHMTHVDDKQHFIHLIGYGENKGKGAAIRYGAKIAASQNVLLMDADSSVPIEYIEKLFDADCDIAIGSRRIEGSIISTPQPFHRVWSGYAFSYLVRLLALPGVKDSQCGMKLFKKYNTHIFESQTIDGFGFDVELLYIARKMKLRIKEVPVLWANDKDSKVKIIKHSLLMFSDIIKIRWNDLRGRYDSWIRVR